MLAMVNLCKYIIINNLRVSRLKLTEGVMNDEQKNLSPIVEKIWSIFLIALCGVLLAMAV